MAEDIVIRLKGEDAGGKALVQALRGEVDKLNASSAKNAQLTTKGGNAAKDAAKGFEQLHGWLKAIAAAEVVRGFIELTKRGIEVAVSLNKLSDQTGVSVEKLSALKFAADQNETSLEALVPAFRGLSKSLEDLNSGAPDAVKNFKAIGLSAKDFKGLSLDQALKKVADRLGEYEDGSGKVAVAQNILGRSAIELLPLLKALSGDGFAKLTKEASDAGLIMSGQTAKAADELDDKMKKLRSSIVAAFTPTAANLDQVTASIDDLTKKSEDGKSKLDAYIQTIGELATAAAKSIPFLGILISRQEDINAQFAVNLELLRGQEKFAAEVFAPPKPDKKIKVQDDAAIALSRARVAALVASLQQELALDKENSKIVDQANKAAFDRGLKALGDYYTERRRIIFKDSADEIEILRRQRAAVASLETTNPAEATAKAQAISAIDAQIAQKRVQTTAQAIQLNNEEIAAQKKLAEDIRTFETSIVAAKGNTLEATKRNIDEEIRKDRELLQQRRTLTAEDEKQLNTKRELLTNQAIFNDLSTQGGREFSDISRQRAAIEEQAREGLISQHDAELQIEQIERDRLPALRAIGQQMTDFANKVGDPALIDAAKNFNAQLTGMGVHVDQAQVAFANFRQDAINALGGALANFLGSTINQVDSVGDAFRQLALDAVQAIQQIIAQLIALQAVKALTGLFGGSSQGKALDTSVQVGLAGLLHASTGGFVRGPGTETSDSIPAMLSAGEYVINARAVRRLGPQLLDALNRGYTPPTLREDLTGRHVQHFAAGGLVEAGARGAGKVDVNVGLSLDKGLILDTMSSSDGAKIHVTHTGNHRKTIKKVLGGS